MLWMLMIFALADSKPLLLEPATGISMSEHDIYSDFSFVVTDDGVIVIGDSDNHRLIYMKKDGEVIAMVGRQGEGPQEFQNMANLKWYPKEGCIRVIDFGNRRISSWSKDGQFIEGIPFPRPMLFDFHFLSKKRILSAKDLAGHFDGKPQLISIDLDSNKIQDLWTQSLGKKMPLTEIPGFMARLNNWDPRLSFVAASDFIAVNWGQSPKMTYIDFDGKPLKQKISLHIPQPPVTDDDVRQQLAEWEPEHRAGLAKGLARAEVWPTVFSMRADHKDNIWVFGHRRQEADPYPIRIFNRKGELISKGEVPNIPEVTKDALYYLTEDEDELILKRSAYKF